MSRKRRVVQPTPAAPPAAEPEAPTKGTPEAETPAVKKVVDALMEKMAAEIKKPPKVWTIDELVEEYFPGQVVERVSGGVLAGLQRELRRRNRQAEKGY